MSILFGDVAVACDVREEPIGQPSASVLLCAVVLRQNRSDRISVAIGFIGFRFYSIIPSSMLCRWLLMDVLCSICSA